MKFKRSKIFSYPGLVVLFITMVILSLFFHQPIQIIDVLTSKPVPGFDIHISVWRVLFEPFFGPLLFYLRASQPLEEFAILLFWILGLSLVLILVRQFFLSGLLSWLKTAPLILATWLGLLWLIIYLPLPANTIVNHQENSILINTHSHTEYSHDGIISTKGLQSWHKKSGYDAFFITDHNHHQQTMEAVMAQDQGLYPKEPLMMIGEEFSGSNHITLLGLKRNFITRGLSDQQVIDSTHADNGVAIVAHWFDGERESIPFYLSMGVDGFEIANQASGLSYDRRIFNDITLACKSNGLIMNGVADYHGYGSSCSVWTALEIPGWHHMPSTQKREAIMEVLRRRDMSRIKVLLYQDRPAMNRSLALLSPLYNLLNYFRSLKAAQVLSWLIWIILFAIIRTRLKSRVRERVSPMQALALAASLFLLSNGFILHLKSRKLLEYNDIYTEYSSLLLWCGAGFLIYSLILIFIGHRRKLSHINQQ